MYIGKAADTAIHDHHAIQIAISLDRPFEIKWLNNSLKLTAVIIDSDEPHECKTSDNTFLFLNIAPESKIAAALKKCYLGSQNISKLPRDKVDDFIKAILNQLGGQETSDNIYLITQQFLHSLSKTDESRFIDERIATVIKILNEKQDDRVPLKELAKLVFISPSRLVHLFTEQVGIPIRKYILWKKLLTAFEKAAESQNIADAALYAGFSDAPHFNRTFKRMFGLNPSTILKNSQIIQVN